MKTLLARQAGELFIVGFHGTILNKEIKEMIHTYHVSGVILFSRNIESAGQLAHLTDTLQEEAQKAGYSEPLLIALDQENGVIRRIERGVSQLPGAMAIAATGDPHYAEMIYAASAEELSRLGVNWDLAPVADINTNPNNPVIGVRAFGDRAEKVGQYVVQAVNGLQEHDVAACLKHFPGHGNTDVDSHLDLPVLKQDLASLQKNELVPFEMGIKAGAAAVMIAHLKFPAVDSKFPASLSSKVITTLLRERLGFKGVVVTDDLEMKAIAAHYGTAAASVRALRSGADLAMVSHVYETQKEAIKAVMAAIETGQLSTEQLRLSTERLRCLRHHVGRCQTNFDAKKFASLVGTHTELATRFYQHSVTVVQAPNHPLSPSDPVVVVTFINQHQSLVVDSKEKWDTLLLAVQHVFPQAVGLTIDWSSSDLKSQLNKIAANAIVIFGTNNVKSFDDLQAVSARELVKRGDSLNVIAVRNPYDCRWLPHLNSYIATYEETPLALECAIAALTGDKKRFLGRLPVSLPET